MTREIDNFFPGMFDYLNVRVYDDEKTNLLKHWDNTFKYITQAHKTGSKVLVHCKMGVSRSASVVIAYAMKAYAYNFSTALRYVKLRRNCIKPNKSFLQQLETYQGMLDAMKNKEKLQRSKSETNLRTSSAKDGRLLPGSEPTPLIQAMNSAAASPSVVDQRTASSGRDSVDASGSPRASPQVRRSVTLNERRRPTERRPSSWSPDHVEAMVLLPKQQSQSLENLTPERKEEKTKNVLLPCSNGQNYSVSQNQVVYLQENVPSVKLIVSELESNRVRTQLARRNRRTIGGVEEAIWTQPREASALLLNQSVALLKPHQPINQLASKSQTSVKPFTATIHHPSHPHTQRNPNTHTATTNHHTTNHHLLCDSPAWTSCSPTNYYAPSSTTSTTSPTCLHTLTNTKPTLSSRAPSHHQTPTTTATTTTNNPTATTTTLLHPHHKSTDIHLCLSKSMATTGSPHTAADTTPASPTPAVSRRRHQQVHADPIAHLRTQHPPQQPAPPPPSVASISLRNHHREMPSRHASWGSGDTKTLPPPARNSSWAAFDLRPNIASTQFLRGGCSSTTQPADAASSSVFAYDRDDIPWHPGTVKRTKQKIESCAVVKRKCSIVPDLNRAGHAPPPPLTAQRLAPTNRWHSEELLPPGAARKLSPTTSIATFHRLSASAPETCTIGCLATGAATTTTAKRRNHQSRNTRSLQPQRSLDANNEGATTAFAATTTSSPYGLVQNLKQNFEAGQQPNVQKKVKSLPSSPIAAHPDKSAAAPDRQFNKFSEPLLDNAEERNVRGLVDLYEVHKANHPAYAIKPRPRSEYIANTSFGFCKPPHMLSHATIFGYRPPDDARRPPVPPAASVAPSVRHTLGGGGAASSCFGVGVPSPVVVSSTTLVSGGSNTLSFRKMQQHGKTHPLTRLGLTNPRLSTATYNTM